MDDDRREHSTFARGRRAILWATPGQLDAAFTSLATFAAGLYALSALEIEPLGAYALLFSAFQVANQVPAELVFIPSQILSLEMPANQRLGMTRHSVPRGVLLAVVSSTAVPLGAVSLAGSTATSDFLALALSALALTMVSPLQDHLRAMLHLAHRSWGAAAISGVHLVTTIAMLPILGNLNFALAPFGALFVGNFLASIVAVPWIRRSLIFAPERPTRRQLNAIGGWLLSTGLVKTGVGYLSRTVLHSFAGVAALGLVEGARVVAQPLNVLGLGLMSQVGPRLMESAASRDKASARRWRRRFLALLAVGAVPYAALASGPWTFNPLATITPRAYELPGLTAAMLIAVIIACWLRPLRNEMLGARKQRAVARITFLLGLVELALVGLAFVIGPFAMPVAIAGTSLFGVFLLFGALRAVYQPGRDLGESDRSSKVHLDTEAVGQLEGPND